MSDEAIAAAKMVIERYEGRVTFSPLEAQAVGLATRVLSDAESRPDDIRSQGWAVAVHNDYFMREQLWTFWLFTKDGRCVKGEGKTDAQALNEVREQISALAA